MNFFTSKLIAVLISKSFKNVKIAIKQVKNQAAIKQIKLQANN